MQPSNPLMSSTCYFFMFYLIAKPHLRRDTYLGESYFSDTHDSIIANISPDS